MYHAFRIARPLLNKQRPLSPIIMYEKQLTSVLSISNRITGVGATVGIYGGILLGAYANLKGIPVAQYFQDFSLATPALLYYPAKLGFAASFAFHTANGVRHLVWDAGYMLKLNQVYQTGYIALGATAVGTLLLLLQ